jgi:hypothetical protein
LPDAIGIAEEGLDTEGFVKPTMLCELGSVVEADGFARAKMEPAYKRIADYACEDNVRKFREIVDKYRKG